MQPQDLTEKRKKLRLTQPQLAERLGLSERQIRRFEAGEIPIEPWLPMALQTMSQDPAELLHPILVRAIRNARSLDDLARIKALMGLAEPELPVTEEELQERIESLFDPERGLYFADDDEEYIRFDKETEISITPSEAARFEAERWIEERFRTRRGREIESRHFLRRELREFFVRLITLSQNEFPIEAPDDSRDRHIEALDHWLDEKFRPFML